MASLPYQFETLKPDEFEQLVSEVLHHALGVPLFKFSLGEDGGRDAFGSGISIPKYEIINKNVVVQVKHTQHANAKLDGKTRKRLLQAEKAKVKRLVTNGKLDVYIFVTNYSIPAEQHDKIEESFEEQGAKKVIPVGRETLTMWISGNRHLMFLCAMNYSIGDLTLRNNLQKRKQTLALLDHQSKEFLNTFVSTKAYEKALNLVKDHKNVVLLDGPEAGKSTILWKLGCEIEETQSVDKNVYICSDFANFESTWNPSEHQVFLIDDIFGKTDFQEEQFKHWDQVAIKLACATRSTCLSRFVIASRKDFFELAFSRSEKDFQKILENAEKIDLKGNGFKLNQATKEAILLSHVENGDSEPCTKEKIKTVLEDRDLMAQIASEEKFPFFLTSAIKIGKKEHAENLTLDCDGVLGFFKKHGVAQPPSQVSSSKLSYKCWTRDGKRKMRVVASSFEEMKAKGGKKLGMNVVKVTEEDGTEVDEESFPYLDKDKPLILLGGETPKGACDDIKIEHDIENIDPQPKSDEENKHKRDQINGCIMADISNSSPLSHQLESCNQYGIQLMEEGVFMTDAEKGSVIITVECETMEALNELWEDYKSGRLNRMAEKCLITEDLKSSCGCQEIKLKTRIEEETYIKYRETLIRKGKTLFDPPYTFNEFNEAVFIWISASVVYERFQFTPISIGNAKFGEPQLASRATVRIGGSEKTIPEGHVAVLVEHNKQSSPHFEAEMKEEMFENAKTKLKMAATQIETGSLIFMTNNDISYEQGKELQMLFSKGSSSRHLYIIDRKEMLQIVKRSPKLLVLVQQEWICAKILPELSVAKREEGDTLLKTETLLKQMELIGKSEDSAAKTTPGPSELGDDLDLDSLEDVMPPAPPEPKLKGVWRLMRTDGIGRKTKQPYTTMSWVDVSCNLAKVACMNCNSSVRAKKSMLNQDSAAETTPGPSELGFQPGTSKEGPFELQNFPVEFLGSRLSEFLKFPVRDVLSYCQESLSKLEMSELGEIWTSDNSYPVVREFFRRLAEKGKQAQDIFFWSLVSAFKTVNTSVTRNIYIALLNARDIVIRPCPEKVVDIVVSQKSSWNRWKEIARELGINNKEIDAIKVEEADDCERTRLALYQWRHIQKTHATTRDIMFALTRVGCAEVNLEIMEELSLIPILQSSNIR